MVRALVVGSLVMDLAFRVPRRPGPGEVVRAGAFGTYRGGKGYNQAVALSRLGAQVVMVGAVGADQHGDDFLAALRRERVDAGRVVQLRGAATSLAAVFITPDGDVSFVQYPGANLQLAPAHCAELPDTDLLLLQGEVPSATSLQAAKVIRRRGGLVVLNPAPAEDVPPELLDSASVIVPNEVEANALTGGGLSGVEAAEALRTPERAAVVTLGRRGAAWADDTGSGEIAPPEVDAVDATGAGDSFCAALGLAIAEGAGLAAATRFACAAGAHAATVAGAEPGLPTRADTEALLVGQ